MGGKKRSNESVLSIICRQRHWGCLFITRELDVFIARFSLLNRAMNRLLVQIRCALYFSIYISTLILALIVFPLHLIRLHIILPIDKYIPSVSAYLPFSPFLLYTQAGTCAHTGKKTKTKQFVQANVSLCPPAVSWGRKEADGALPSVRCSAVNYLASVQMNRTRMQSAPICY